MLIASRNQTPAELAADLSVDMRTFMRWLSGTNRPAKARFDVLKAFWEGGGKLSQVERDLLTVGYQTSEPRPDLTTQNVFLSFSARGQMGVEATVIPAAPSQTGFGPALAPTRSGFDIQPQPPPDVERLDPGQIALHRRLQRHVERLQSAIIRISNTHALLADEFGDYALFLSADLASLDVPSLWSVGTGLSEQLTALTSAGPGVMTPELEPDILAEFRGLLRDHTAFIQGFAIGRELHERVVKVREAAEANPQALVHLRLEDKMPPNPGPLSASGLAPDGFRASGR